MSDDFNKLDWKNYKEGNIAIAGNDLFVWFQTDIYYKFYNCASLINEVPAHMSLKEYMNAVLIKQQYEKRRCFNYNFI